MVNILLYHTIRSCLYFMISKCSPICEDLANGAECTEMSFVATKPCLLAFWRQANIKISSHLSTLLGVYFLSESTDRSTSSQADAYSD